MQSKACFNFKSLTDQNVSELESLVRQGIERFKSEGLR
jgi:hypothetical protein